MQTKTVDYRFRLLYALGIVMIVCGHCQGGGISHTLASWFPYGGNYVVLFAFSSGYFHKKDSETQLAVYAWKKFKKLIVPLYLYTFAYALLVRVSRHWGFTIGGDPSWYNLLISPLNDGHVFAYNLASWFLAPLFLLELGTALLRRLLHALRFPEREGLFFLLSLVLGLCGNTLACRGFLQGWWLALVRVLYLLPFYALGIWYRTGLERFERRLPTAPYLAALLLLDLVLMWIYGRPLDYLASWCDNFTEGPLMPIVMGTISIAFWLRVCSVLEPAIGRSRFVNLIAENTYPIMVNHFLGFLLVKTVFALIAGRLGWTDFNWIGYKNDLWWYYVPKNLEPLLVLYPVAGIAVSIGIQRLLTLVQRRLPFSQRTNRVPG